MDFCRLITLAFMFCLNAHFAEGKKILYFCPGVSNSHIVFTERFTESIYAADSSHEISILSFHWDHLRRLKSKMIPDERIHHFIWEFSKRFTELIKRIVFEDVSFAEQIQMSLNTTESWVEGCREVIAQYERLKQLRAQKFDLAIALPIDACHLAIIHQLGIKDFVWDMVGTYITDYVTAYQGIDRTPSFIPFLGSEFTDRMTFIERLKNTGYYAMIEMFMATPSMTINVEAKDYQEPPNNDHPDLRDMFYDSAGIFINGELVIDFPRPLFHTHTYIGRMKSIKINDTDKTEAKSPDKADKTEAQNKTSASGQAITEEWRRLIEDERFQGVVLFSFGTISQEKYMPQKMRIALLREMSALKEYRVIWKFDGEFPEADDVPNISIAPWIPQKAILAHPRCVCFVTHSGFNSLLESAQSGVPVVTIPLFNDQFANAARAQRLKIGVKILKAQLTETGLLERLVRRVIDDERYRNAARHLTEMINDRLGEPHKVVNTKLRWMTKPHRRRFYSTRHIAEMSLITYWCLDVLLLWTGLLALIIYGIVKIAFKINRILR